MTIVKFVPAFSRLSQTFIYGLACELDDQLSAFRVLTLEREHRDERPFESVDILDQVTSSPDRGQISIWTRLFGDAEQAERTIRLKEYFETIQPAVVHAHFGPSAAMVVDACEQADIPLVVSLRGYDASRLVQERKWRNIYADVFPRCHRIVLITDEMRHRIEPLAGGVPLRTIYAGKNIEDYHYGAPTAPIRRFLSIGRLVDKKGHADAIRAIGQARTLGADVSLRIIGEGKNRNSLQSLIQAEQLSPFVELVGRLPHDEVKSELRRADAFILACTTAPSGDKEGVPNVIKEAQLVGLPVLSTRHAGVPDAVPEANHRWLADEGDWQQMGVLIDELSALDDGSLHEMTQLARQHVVEYFSRSGEVANYLALYDEVSSSQEKR